MWRKTDNPSVLTVAAGGKDSVESCKGRKDKQLPAKRRTAECGTDQDGGHHIQRQPVITEAMAAGVVPIVMNTFKDADLNIKNGYNGLLTPPFDTKEMAKQVLQLAKDKFNLQKMSGNAKQTVKCMDNNNRLKIWSELTNDN